MQFTAFSTREVLVTSLFTLAEAAEELKISRRTAYYYVQNGTLEAAKIGGQWRIKKQVIDRMLRTAASPLSSRDTEAYEDHLEEALPGATIPPKQTILGVEAKLWQAADLMRNNVDPAEFKHLVLGLLFLRSASLLQHMPQGFKRSARSTAVDVPEEALWNSLAAKTNSSTFGRCIDAALLSIEKRNSRLKNALPTVYANTHLSNRRLIQLFHLIGEIGLSLPANQARDSLGRVYEYFLARFASAESKNGGEFYTPPSIVRLLVELLEPTNGYVYDPCCGSGGMFIQSERFISDHGGKRDNVKFFGQESNRTTWRLARMNLAIRGLDANLSDEAGDTLLNDLHPRLRADYILANPPFNVSGWGADLLVGDHRWAFGPPPDSNANYAWLQHIYSHLSEKGVAAVVLANGSVSSTANGEGEIRQRMIESGIVDSVVALPGQMFYATQVPVCVWILASPGARKNRRGEVLFIDARGLGRMESRVHRVFDHSDISKVTTAYKEWKERRQKAHKNIPGFSYSASIDEISEQRYILSPGRYVGSQQPDKDELGRPLHMILSDLTSLLNRSRETDAKLLETLVELQSQGQTQ